MPGKPDTVPALTKSPGLGGGRATGALSHAVITESRGALGVYRGKRSPPGESGKLLEG